MSGVHAADVFAVRRRVYDAVQTGAIRQVRASARSVRGRLENTPAIGERLNGIVGHLQAPVGRECVDVDVLQSTEGQPSERCEGCDRPIYYWRGSRLRRRALCSDRCRQLVSNRRHARVRQQAKKRARDPPPPPSATGGVPPAP